MAFCQIYLKTLVIEWYKSAVNESKYAYARIYSWTWFHMPPAESDWEACKITIGYVPDLKSTKSLVVIFDF